MKMHRLAVGATLVAFSAIVHAATVRLDFEGFIVGSRSSSLTMPSPDWTIGDRVIGFATFDDSAAPWRTETDPGMAANWSNLLSFDVQLPGWSFSNPESKVWVREESVSGQTTALFEGWSATGTADFKGAQVASWGTTWPELDPFQAYIAGYQTYENGVDLSQWYAQVDLLRLTTVSAVPLPSAIWLFGSAFLGLFGLKRRKRRGH